MAAFVRNLFVNGPGNPEVQVTIDLGSAQPFVAWGIITWIDPKAPFDRDNAVAIDITEIDGVPTPLRAIGGDHLGNAEPPLDPRNLRQTAVKRDNTTVPATGRRVTFRLRAFHGLDLTAAGNAIVITNP
jgi:hypothetical protein